MGNILPKFDIGDLVCHKTNPEIKMIVLDIDNDVDTENEIEYECSWVDKDGKYRNEDLLEIELEKAK